MKHMLVHRLVVKYFIGNCENHIIHHKDGIRDHNCVNNLEISSYKINMKNENKNINVYTFCQYCSFCKYKRYA